MAYVAPLGSYIREIPGYGQVAFSPNHRPLGIVLNNGNPGAIMGTWDGLGSPSGGRGGGRRGGFHGHGHSNRGGHGSGNRGWGGMGRGLGGMRPIITQITGVGGGGGRMIVNSVDMTDRMGGGGWSGGGFGTYPGGWGGHGTYYPTTRPVNPHRELVPGGSHGTPGHNHNSTYPGASIAGPTYDVRDDPRGTVTKKLRDAPEKLKKEDLPEDGKDCSICYTPFWEKPEAGEPEVPVKLRSCGHVFGERCLNEWVQGNNSCPSCRKEFPVVRAR